MTIRFGNVRMVLLVMGFAIKFARIRPICFIRWVLGFEPDYDEYFKHKKCRILWVLGSTLIGGFLSNRREYFYSKGHPGDARIKPISKMFLFGLVTIQPRGEEVTSDNVPEEAKYLLPQDCRLKYFKQYARFGEGSLLIDYGSRSTIKVLKSTYRIASTGDFLYLKIN